MRVVIDAVPLLLRSAGVKTYVYEWIRHLRRLAGGDRVRAFPFLELPGDYSHDKSVLGLPQTAARLAFLHAVNYSGLPVLDWIGPRTDVFHVSHQLWNPPRSVRLTATIYDMTCWVAPEMHPPGNVKGARRFARRVINRADGLIAISESTKSDAMRILGLPSEKIEVIYPGVAGHYFDVPAAAAREAAGKYALSRPYVLFVGTVEPRKNIGALLDAWGQLPVSLRQEYLLAAAGPVGWAEPRTVARLRSVEASMRYLGYVPEADLPGLTAGASLFVYPSLYEGFGLPVAQAMAAGVPVITSNVSSLPEVAGDAGVLVDPRSPSEIRSAIERFLSSPALRSEAVAKGLARARRFTWEACAQKSLAFFERVCGS